VEPVLTLTDAPDDAAKAAVSAGLHEFNDLQSGGSDRRGLSIIVSDTQTGKPLGGLIGRTSLGVFLIELFYLPESLRKNGLGRRIVAQAEDEARRRGCLSAVLYTISFQAPGFYERCGYRRFGKVMGTNGISRVFLSKSLA
jgi:GNAT superfamily N-acetyltransferase